MNQMNMKRLVKDIQNIFKNPIDNIYYKHDEENMYKGYAMIIGNETTPYAYGYYLFEFNFNNNYPYEPPVVTYYTNDGSTRFNPNFYINGKVCLSILNTWRGEGWTSCQSITSILLVLSTVIHDKPLLNEPGLTENHKDYDNYNNMIAYKNIEIAIIGILTKKYLNNNFLKFYDIILETFNNNYDNIQKNLSNHREILTDNKFITFNLYNSKYLVNFELLNEKLKNLKKSELNNLENKN